MKDTVNGSSGIGLPNRWLAENICRICAGWRAVWSFKSFIACGSSSNQPLLSACASRVIRQRYFATCGFNHTWISDGQVHQLRAGMTMGRKRRRVSTFADMSHRAMQPLEVAAPNRKIAREPQRRVRGSTRSPDHSISMITGNMESKANASSVTNIQPPWGIFLKINIEPSRVRADAGFICQSSVKHETLLLQVDRRMCLGRS